MNITTRSMSKRAGRKFIALDSEDEDPDYELDTNVEETDLEEIDSEQEELSDISEEETGETGEIRRDGGARDDRASPVRRPVRPAGDRRVVIRRRAPVSVTRKRFFAFLIYV